MDYQSLSDRLRATIYAGLLCVTTALLTACHVQEARFNWVPSGESGITFVNQLALTDSFNILDYMYFFNGGGVAAGDINNDGLTDLYFSGNLVSGRLYLNLGNMKFRDITETASVATSGWGSGVSMCDVNQDGWLDIYLCQTGYPEPERRKNRLFINQGDLTFRDEAEAYGLADTGYTTQAAFFDFDRDGDLDIYLLNHDHQFRGTNLPLPKKKAGESPTTDRLLENRPGPAGHPVFADISTQAGIVTEGFGLGISVADIDGDLWPDVYVSNDFISNDLLLRNQQDGTFLNMIDSVIMHQSYNGMGNDVADINNDGLPEIYVADMLPYLNSRRKMMAMNTSEDLFEASIAMGYAPQYTRNSLQLHNGFKDHHLLPFSEIAQMVGLHSTDWSWSPVFGDVDNDGWKDLFITNGYYRDITDLDFITYRRHRATFSSESVQDSLYLRLMREQPMVRVPNFLFRNHQGWSFSDSTGAWGLEVNSLSNGGILVDLDNDGDLDIVTNNLDEPASLIENRTSAGPGSHYVKIKPEGPDQNRNGIGMKVFIHQKDNSQYTEFQLAHGYLSSIHAPLHFGLGKVEEIDSIVVVWPDGMTEILINPPADTLITIKYQSQMNRSAKQKPATKRGRIRLSEITSSLGLIFRHRENIYQDFKQDQNTPFRLSRQGPAIAVGDVNGDQLDDVFLGGAAGFPAAFFIQTPEGRFEHHEFSWHEEFEDVDAALFDADQDGDLDLYVVSGGVEFQDFHFYQDRFYRNDGRGQLDYIPSALPGMAVSGSGVRPADFDRDGDLDLLVTGRVVPGNFGADASSVLLENRDGRFVDVSEMKAPGLLRAGMVTDAVWTDINLDQKPDFILVGDWMPVTLYAQSDTGFIRQPLNWGNSTGSAGWWQSIEVTDLDSDGDPDLVLGNLGNNLDMKITPDYPATLHLSDFDGNGHVEAFVSYFQIADGGNRIDYPSQERDAVIKVVPSWKKKYFDYHSYAHARAADIFVGESGETKKAYHQESMILLNEPGTFRSVTLPAAAQISVIRDVLPDDFDKNGITDLLIVGNNYETRVDMGFLDASLGCVLLGTGSGDFSPVKPAESQFIAGGNTRSIRKIRVGLKMVYLVVRNDAALSAFILEDQ